MKYDQWSIASPCPEGRSALEGAGYSPLLAAVLSARGIRSPHAAAELLSPDEECLFNPLLMKDMDKAAQRLRLGVERGELMAVYGDYDVDGITSTCLLTDLLTRMGGRVIPYIPSRLDEGYGLNSEAIAALAQQGVQLIITVDCGITAVEETAYAASLGIDVVITDHHECKDILPDAVAVVNPHRPDCPYPFQGLAGVGVALKLAMAVSGPDQTQTVLNEYADLACIGTVADVMPMSDENRTIVRRGLAALAHPTRLGLAHLLRESGLEGKTITSVSIGYTLAPRINASGRMGCAQLAVDLLLTKDPVQATALARELCELNRERQSIESDIFEDCIRQLSLVPQQGVVVLADAKWHQGVVGVVASRMCEKCAAPCFMICLDQGMGKGSCRSWGGINLFALLSQCDDLLEGFGGHALAAGFTVREENIPPLAERLRQLVFAEYGTEPLPSTLSVDAAVQPCELTVDTVCALDRLEPCGTGNPRPVFVLHGATVLVSTQVGHGRHLKLKLDARGVPLDAIFFSADGNELGLTPGCRIDVAFYPQINDFRGNRCVQLQVIDLQPALTRAQQERNAYVKYSRGEPLSQEEGQALLPHRADFVGLWRWLEGQAAHNPVIHDTAARISRHVSRAFGRAEVPERTMLCLEVMEERGLISLSRGVECLSITLHKPEHKVDLEDSSILRLLRGYSGG